MYVRLYGLVTVCGFRRYATYRMAMLGGIFANTAFGFVVAYTYMALWDQRPGLGGYDMAQALTYAWVGQALVAPMSLIHTGFAVELAGRIRTGDIAVDLYRPVDLQLWWLATDMGRAAFELIGRGVIPLAVGALVFPLALPTDPVTWLLFMVAVFLGAVTGFALRYLYALTAFWLLDAQGVLQFGMLASMVFTGMLLPLNAMPGLIGEVAQLLPWAAMLQIPADILMGERAAMSGYLFQLGWAAVLLLAGRAMQSAATRKVVVQGG